MKYVTGGYVGMEEAVERLAQVIDPPECAKFNIYWAWNDGAQQVGRWSDDGKPKGTGGSGGEVFENSQSNRVMDGETVARMWELSVEAYGLSQKELPKAAMAPRGWSGGTDKLKGRSLCIQALLMSVESFLSHQRWH